MINRITILGRLVKDPELNVTPTGIYYARATIANEQTYKEAKHTNFVDIVAWRGLAQNLCNYCHKGRKILIDGRLEVRKHTKEDRTYINTSIIAENIDFLDIPESQRKEVEKIEAEFREVRDEDCPF